jgi:hypothetical protein
MIADADAASRLNPSLSLAMLMAQLSLSLIRLRIPARILRPVAVSNRSRMTTFFFMTEIVAYSKVVCKLLQMPWLNSYKCHGRYCT